MPGRIISTVGDGLTRTAEVDFGGVRSEVNLALVPEAASGDYIIVHVGVAIARLDEAAAQETLATLAALARAGADPDR